MKNSVTFILVTVLLLSNCNSSSESFTEKEKYQDGTYCADVDYYNPKTQRTSSYSLNVEVTNGKLVKIKWSNSGWLDENHFTAPIVSDNGTCSFTSDKGYSYTIDIKGAECSSTDNPEDIDGSMAYFKRSECANVFNASPELFNRFLKSRKVSADDIISEKDCDLMHESFETLSRLMKLEKKIDEGYIQKHFSWKGGFGGSCQTIVVKRHGSFYVLEITSGEATMGLTSFDTKITDWQRITIQENPNVDKWVVVMARVIANGSKLEMEDLSESICK